MELRNKKIVETAVGGDEMVKIVGIEVVAENEDELVRDGKNGRGMFLAERQMTEIVVFAFGHS